MSALRNFTEPWTCTSHPSPFLMLFLIILGIWAWGELLVNLERRKNKAQGQKCKCSVWVTVVGIWTG